MFDFSQLIKISFWFAKNPGGAGEYFTRLAFIFGFLFLIALVIYLFTKKIKRKDLDPVWLKLWGKVYTCLFTVSIVGGALMFFRYEGILFLSMRFLMLFLFVGFLVWAIFISVYYLRDFKQELFDHSEQKRKEKYLK